MAADANGSYETPKALSAKELVIDFLSNRAPREISARVIVDSAAALGFSEQSIRMALTRLVEDGLARSPARGVYQLAPSAEVMRREVRKWRNIANLTQPWSGAWVSVYDAPIRRSDRAALRRHEQALRLRGFRELIAGLWIRPANLRDSVADLRDQLRALGLHPDAIAAAIGELDDRTRARATHLWDTKALLESYEGLTRAMNASTRRVAHQAIEVAAGETLVLGRDVLRHINTDPLLPAELMPEQPLRDLVRTMITYDDMARQIWRRFMSQFEAR
jgi:phenylacetic acid degradation operon negative regulatory protein